MCGYGNKLCATCYFGDGGCLAATREEMTRRGYRTMNSVWNKIVALKPDYLIVPLNELYKDKMDTVYLNICYYNLYEKYLCGGIKEED